MIPFALTVIPNQAEGPKDQRPSVTMPPTIGPELAARRGLHPLTTKYHLPHHAWMLENVVRDMAAGAIECALVMVLGDPDVVEVWRKPSSVRCNVTGASRLNHLPR